METIMATPEGTGASPGSLSSRGQHTLTFTDVLKPFCKTVRDNPYHPESNPEGIVDCGDAVNSLMEDELTERLTKEDAVRYTPHHQHYFDRYGTQRLLQTLVDFYGRHFKPARPVQADQLVVVTGLAACLDTLGHVLFEPGDVIITPSPNYKRIFSYFSERAQAVVRSLYLKPEPDSNGMTFSLTAEALDARIRELTSEGDRVRGVILLNPHNPLGEVLSQTLLEELLQVCARHGIHAILDEVYGLSVFDPDTRFCSVHSLPTIPDPSRTHQVWGLSKDLCLAGFRVGVIHSLNNDVIKAARSVAYYQCVPNLIQDAAITLLGDTEWFDNFFLPTNRRKLREAYNKACGRIEEMGVVVRKAKAGFFLWINLEPFLHPCTPEEEFKLFEEAYRQGVFLYPGSQMYNVTPGWFRIVFSIKPQHLDEALNRLEKVLHDRSALQK